MKKLFLLFILISSITYGQDTLFMRNYSIGSVIRIDTGAPYLWERGYIIKVSNSKKRKIPFKVKDHLIPASLIFVAGAMDGLNQVLLYRYDGFKKAFPGINNQWWNPEVSWTNKYKNHNPAEGRRFPGSKTWLVPITDGYHATRALNHLLLVGAVTIKIGEKGQKWYVYAIQAVSYMIVYKVGFSTVYYRF